VTKYNLQAGFSSISEYLANPAMKLYIFIVQVEAQNLHKKESQSMTTNSSKQNPNIFAKTKQQLEQLQHCDMQPLVGMFKKL